jgi:hypothetical protein
MIVEARALRGDIMGGVLLDVETLEDGVDVAVVSGATEERPERNALENCGLEVAKLVVRGWAVVVFIAGR